MPKPIIRDFRIYAILCPRNKSVRYIGCTSRSDVRKRVSELSGGMNTKLSGWLQSLKTVSPLIVIIETITAVTRSEAESIEQKWIRKYYEEGQPLLNIKGIIKANLHPINDAMVFDLCGKLNNGQSISQILEETKKQNA